MESVDETERNFQLFKTGLFMISRLTEIAIHVLEKNLKGIQGLFVGLKQWGVIVSIGVEYHERSLIKHKDLICEKQGRIADALTLPLIKNMQQLRELCYKERSEQTLIELQVYKSHVDYLLNIQREDWTKEMLDTHIFIIIQEEMQEVLKALTSLNQTLE